MTSTLLVPWSERRIVQCDDTWLVVDKPPGIVVHGGSEEYPGDTVTRLAAFLSLKGEPTYLGVHQRLDVDASGALFFTRDRSVNGAVAQDMESRRAARTYLIGVSGRGLPESGCLEHQLAPDHEGRMRPVKRGGKLARLRFKVLQRDEDRALCEVRLETGRTHQIRAQFAAERHPLAGDRWYGGGPASRLLLHARSLTLPALGRSAQVPPPLAFDRWLRGTESPSFEGQILTRALEDAVALRWPIRHVGTAFRLVNDSGDGLLGLTVDIYGQYALMAVTSAAAEAASLGVAEWLVNAGVRGVYRVNRLKSEAGLSVQARAPDEPFAGEAAKGPLTVTEGSLRFQVSLGGELSSGLFLDQRDNRHRILKASAGKRVLNLFAYTCSFGVAAAVGGARSTTNVDLSGPYLERGRANYALNDLSSDSAAFYRADVVQWLRRALKRGDRYEIVVLDPPTFSTKKGGTFRVSRDYGQVASMAMGLLSPGGRLLAVTNHRAVTQRRLRSVLHEAARRAGREVQQLKDLSPTLDCPTPVDGDRAKSALVTLA